MKRILALILAVLMMATMFTACGFDDEDIIGKWSSTSDIAKKFNDTVNAKGSLKEALTLKEFKIKTVYNFKDDGTYEIRVDSDALATTIKNTKADLKTQFASAFGSIAKANEIFAASNVTVDDLINTMFNDEVIVVLVGQPVAGQYLLEDGNLYLSASLSEKVDKKSYIEIDITDKKLVFESFVGKDTKGLKKQTFKKEK